MTNHEQQVKDLQDLVNGAIDQLGENVSPDARKKFLEIIPKIMIDGKSVPEAIGLSPEMMEELYIFAYNFFYAGKYKDAIPLFNFLRQVDPSDFRYTFALGACYQMMGDYLNATVNYISCSQLDPFNPLPYFHLYDCFKKSGHLFSAYHALYEAQIFAEENPEYEALKQKIALELEGFKLEFEAYIREKYGSASKEELKGEHSILS